MKKFIAIITLVSMLSCVSCNEKTELGSVSSSSSSSTVDSSSVAESAVEENGTEETSSIEESNEDEDYKDWYGLHMFFPTMKSDRDIVSSSCGYPVWYEYKGEKPNVDFTRGYSMAVGSAPDGDTELSPEEAAEEFFGYEVPKLLGEAYGQAVINERNPEKTENVKVLDKDFIRETGILNVGNLNRGEFTIYYVCYVGTPGFADSLFEKSPAIWIAFSDDESDKGFIAEMVDRAANDLEYTK